MAHYKQIVRQQESRKEGVKELAAAARLIRQGETAPALRGLDRLAEKAKTVELRGKILGLVGDAAIRQGDYTRAAKAFEGAGQLAEYSMRSLRAALGQLRVLLSEGNFDRSAEFARGMIDSAIESERKEREHLAKWNGRDSLVVLERVQRPSVVATRIASAFLRAGAPEMAATFLRRALELQPNGATRARILLASLAFRNRDYATAERHASEALDIGRYGAKTLSAWGLLLNSQAHLGILSPTWTALSGRLKSAPTTVRARAVFEAMKALRSRGDLRWREYASEWSSLPQNRSTNTRIAGEIAKIMLADAVINKAPVEEQLTKAVRLKETKEISPREWMIATKVEVKAAIAQGRPVDVGSLVHRIRSLAAKSVPLQISLRHSLAKLLSRFGDRASAETLLLGNRAQLSERDKLFAATAFALARIERSKGRRDDAASHYLSVFRSDAVSPANQISGLCGWAATIVSGQSDSNSTDIAQRATKVVAQISDYRSAMHVAYLAVGKPGVFANLGRQALARGENLALAALAREPSRLETTAILYRLSRRRYDYGNFDKIVAQWRAMTANSREWLRSEASDYAEYLGLVFRAYWRLDEREDAIGLAEGELSRKPLLPLAAGQLATLLGLRLISTARKGYAFELFETAATQAPLNSITGYAHYWLAVREFRRTNQAAALKAIQACRQSLGSKPQQGWQVRLAAATYVLESLIDPTALDRADGKHLKHGEMATEIVKADLSIL